MIINGQALLEMAPIMDMIPSKEKAHGFSHGLSEVGYDIRLKQRVRWFPPDPIQALSLFQVRDKYRPAKFEKKFKKAFFGYTEIYSENGIETRIGRCLIASSIECFQIPPGLWCEFRNKSTHARCFVDASIGTDGEPNWTGYLTIEIMFHDLTPIDIPAGSGIMKAVFHELKENAYYPADGKYANQPDRPVAAIFERAS